jgi:molecular chaperone GrpE
MKSEKESQENRIGEIALDGSGSPSLDDFIKELEEKEKDLHISSDLVVEIEELDINEDDAAELLKFLDDRQPARSNGIAPPRHIETDYAPYNEKLAKQENFSKLENEVEKLREQVSKFETERSEVNELARRRQYDFDNYRKRTERQRSEMFQDFLSNVASEILPVLDNLNRALDSAEALPGGKSNDFQQFINGIVLVNQQLNEVLGEMGIQPIIAIGEPFDPHRHEAVATEQTEAFPPHTVISELQRGYRLNDKIIRPSLVKVSTSGSPEAE